MPWNRDWDILQVQSINVAWISEEVSGRKMSKMRTAMDEAWRSLCDSAEWREWYQEHYDQLGTTENVLNIGDYKKASRYVGRGESVDGYISAQAIAGAPDMVVALKDVTVKFYEKRAAQSELPKPPTP